ncbi:hypothetical protein ElyMa_001428600, partial [Elysia marginata]
ALQSNKPETSKDKAVESIPAQSSKVPTDIKSETSEDKTFACNPSSPDEVANHSKTETSDDNKKATGSNLTQSVEASKNNKSETGEVKKRVTSNFTQLIEVSGDNKSETCKDVTVLFNPSLSGYITNDNKLETSEGNKTTISNPFQPGEASKDNKSDTSKDETIAFNPPLPDEVANYNKIETSEHNKTDASNPSQYVVTPKNIKCKTGKDNERIESNPSQSDEAILDNKPETMKDEPIPIQPGKISKDYKSETEESNETIAPNPTLSLNTNNKETELPYETVEDKQTVAPSSFQTSGETTNLYAEDDWRRRSSVGVFRTFSSVVKGGKKTIATAEKENFATLSNPHSEHKITRDKSFDTLSDSGLYHQAISNALVTKTTPGAKSDHTTPRDRKFDSSVHKEPNKTTPEDHAQPGDKEAQAVAGIQSNKETLGGHGYETTQSDRSNASLSIKPNRKTVQGGCRPKALPVVSESTALKTESAQERELDAQQLKPSERKKSSSKKRSHEKRKRQNKNKNR